MRFYSGMKNSRFSLRTFTLLVAVLLLLTMVAAAAPQGTYLLYVGTYTEEGSKSKGIYAYRYGYVPASSSISITEQEFDFAQEKKKPTFCFFVDDDHVWLPRYMEPEPGQSKLKMFKQKILIKVVRDTFTTPEDLAYKIAASLGRFLIVQKVKEGFEKIPKNDNVSSESERDQVARRAARLESVIRGARVLLVNDVPSEMRHAIAILRALTVEVEVVTSSEDAISLLRQHPYDVVISDMCRGPIQDEGMRFLDRMRSDGLHIHTIFTVGQYEPSRGTPPYAFGITNRMDELLNLLFDAFERIRG